MTDMKITTEYNTNTEDLPHAEPADFFAVGFNDLELDDTGDIKVLSGTDKLAQDVLKFVVTKPGTNPYFQGYGIDFSDLVGTPIKEGQESYLKAQLKDKIVNGLKDLQKTLVDRPDNEQIGAMVYFDVEFAVDEVKVEFSLLSKSQETLNILVSIQGG